MAGGGGGSELPSPHGEFPNAAAKLSAEQKPPAELPPTDGGAS